MATAYARKVDQQRGYVEQTLKSLNDASGGRQASLIQAGYLQLELALRWYLLELLSQGDGAEPKLEFVSPEAIAQLSLSMPCSELRELVDLMQRPQSWMARFIEQLRLLRSGAARDTLKGPLFQRDDSEPDVDAPANQIAVADVSSQAVHANAEDLLRAAEDFSRLVERQRAVRAEF